MIFQQAPHQKDVSSRGQGVLQIVRSISEESMRSLLAGPSDNKSSTDSEMCVKGVPRPFVLLMLCPLRCHLCESRAEQHQKGTHLQINVGCDVLSSLCSSCSALLALQRLEFLAQCFYVLAFHGLRSRAERSELEHPHGSKLRTAQATRTT